MILIGLSRLVEGLLSNPPQGVKQLVDKVGEVGGQRQVGPEFSSDDAADDALGHTVLRSQFLL